MTGNASWEQIWAIAGVIVAVGVAAFLASWRIQVYLAKSRLELEDKLEAGITDVEDNVGSLEERIRALENYNAGLRVILDHIEQFRVEVKEANAKFREERAQDMSALHRRLDAMHNMARMMGSGVGGGGSDGGE